MLSVLRLVVLAIAVGRNRVEPFRKIKAMTYNTGLVESTVPAEFLQVTSMDRRDKIIESLNALDVDFICLQEVYFGDDVAAIVEGVKEKFPASFSKIHNENDTVDGATEPPNIEVCDQGVFLPLTNCISIDCGPVDILECAAQNCTDQLAAVFTRSSQDCLTCFTASLPNLPQFYDQCANPENSTNLRQINAPGLLMLSNTRLRKQTFVDFHPKTTEAINQGYLKANVGKGSNRILAVCAHLTSITPGPYLELNLQGKFASYEEQNLYQVNKLIKKFSTKSPVLVLGDFNVGPTIPGLLPVDPVAEDNYNLLAGAFGTVMIGECTLCPFGENVYNGEDQNSQLDHIFANGVIFKKPQRELTTATCSLVIEDFLFPCSDRYAVRGKLVKLEEATANSPTTILNLETLL